MSRRKIKNSAQDGIDDQILAFFGRVRDVRVEVQNIYRLALEIKEKSELTEPRIRDQEVKYALIENKQIFSSNGSQIDARIEGLRNLLESNPKLYDLYGDQVISIENAWQRASLNWPSPERSEEVFRKTTRMIEALKEIVRCSGMLTIPNRVRQHLDQQRVGGVLNFHEYFKDELPEAEDRMFILSYIHSHPAIVSGIISVEEGLIYAASPSPRRQHASLLAVVLLALAGFGAIVFACQFRMINCDDLGGLKNLLQAYALTLAGATAHVLVDFLKRDRASKATISGLREWLLHIHVKELSFIQATISLWVGFLLLAYSVRTPIEPGTAFLLGYSIDSFLDLFLQRFTKKISVGTQALQQKI